MSTAENQPHFDIDQVILDFQASHVDCSFLQVVPEAKISAKTQALLDKVLADPKFGNFLQSGEKSIGFNAFKEASTIFKQAFERTQNSRGNH